MGAKVGKTLVTGTTGGMKAWGSLPEIKLRRDVWLRLALVAVLGSIALARVVPDALRVVEPIGEFHYITDENGVVLRSLPRVPKGSERLLPGDLVRIDRVPKADRKPGLAGPFAFSYDNRERELPIERGRHLRLAHLMASDETPGSRVTVAIQIVAFTIVVVLGALLFAIQPSITTGAIFVYCLSAEFPASYIDVALDRPWREIPLWTGDVFAGIGLPAVLIFALSLWEHAPRTRRLALAPIAAVALALGVLHAAADWRITYLGIPSQALETLYTRCSAAVALATIAVFAVAFVRASGDAHRRVAWIAAAFALAGVARLASDQLYPERIGSTINDVLVASSVVPIIVVWFSIVRHRAFDIDLAVHRAITYAVLTGFALGTITVAEEVGTYVFYQNTDLAYAFVILFSMGIGSATGKIKTVIDLVVDRFIFRDRHERKRALELIGGYVLDAESDGEVYRALLDEVPHALKLSFAGVFARGHDGGFTLRTSREWPDECQVRFGASDVFVRELSRSRGAKTFSGAESKLIKGAFPRERLAFAAPLFENRTMSAIVVYGENVSGLDLDSDERESLVRVLSNASLALAAVELERLRALSGPPPDTDPSRSAKKRTRAS